mmetsp:Transcript_9233/g.20390  ORF Transcript_9233/g.20390 Transcript_9233/m.20390 type:complete len:222 (+) Transcript_9233:464-1129(+)
MRRMMCGLYGCSYENTNTSGNLVRNFFSPPTCSFNSTISWGILEASLSRLERSSVVMRPAMESASMQKVRIADSETMLSTMKLQNNMFCQFLSIETDIRSPPYLLSVGLSPCVSTELPRASGRASMRYLGATVRNRESTSWRGFPSQFWDIARDTFLAPSAKATLSRAAACSCRPPSMFFSMKGCCTLKPARWKGVRVCAGVEGGRVPRPLKTSSRLNSCQ